jgi:isocitrate/isopropylmalate dehydrogenase
MSEYRIIVLPGDGIGPEIMKETIKVLRGITAGMPEVELDFFGTSY